MAAARRGGGAGGRRTPGCLLLWLDLRLLSVRLPVSSPSDIVTSTMSLDSSPPSRPDISRVPSYIQFTPKRAMASFENLVALANYEEALREARKIVWRDRGERPVEVQDLWECLEHASRGALSMHAP